MAEFLNRRWTLITRMGRRRGRDLGERVGSWGGRDLEFEEGLGVVGIDGEGGAAVGSAGLGFVEDGDGLPRGEIGEVGFPEKAVGDCVATTKTDS